MFCFRKTSNQSHGNQRIPALAPGVQPALQWSDVPHTFTP
jgi:hypothetical protein